MIEGMASPSITRGRIGSCRLSGRRSPRPRRHRQPATPRRSSPAVVPTLARRKSMYARSPSTHITLASWLEDLQRGVADVCADVQHGEGRPAGSSKPGELHQILSVDGVGRRVVGESVGPRQHHRDSLDVSHGPAKREAVPHEPADAPFGGALRPAILFTPDGIRTVSARGHGAVRVKLLDDRAEDCLELRGHLVGVELLLGDAARVDPDVSDAVGVAGQCRDPLRGIRDTVARRDRRQARLMRRCRRRPGCRAASARRSGRPAAM